jgi:hypothetical protein
VALGGVFGQLQHPAVFTAAAAQALVKPPQQPGTGLSGSRSLTVARKITSQSQASGFQSKVFGHRTRAINLAVKGFSTAELTIFFSLQSLQQ